MKRLFRAFLPCLAVVAAALAVTMVGGGCLGYRAGSVAHPQIRRVCVGDFTNLTDEPQLAVLLRSKLAEALAREGSFELADCARADVRVQGRVVSYALRGIGSAKLRDDAVKPDDRSAYKTVHYRADLVVEFELVAARVEERTVLAAAMLTGEGAFPEVPDMNTARQVGLEQAAADAAAQMAAALSEAW